MKNKIFMLFIAAMLSVMPSAFADEITEYDIVKYTNTCETEEQGLTLTDGAPDGSKYYSYTGTQKMLEIGGLNGDTTEDYMWETDVRFDANGAGFTIRSTSSLSVDTCIRRYDESDGTMKLAVQTGSSKYTKYDTIDSDTWYHIQLIGQYGTDEPVSMEVYKWENGEKVFLNVYDNVNKRNNGPAAYFAAEPGTSIDNLSITKLGADTMTITSTPTDIKEINAGSSIILGLSAMRNGRAITAPEVEWSVEENGNTLIDKSVTVSKTGVVTASLDCPQKDIVIKVLSIDKGNIEATYALHINEADMENEKFDTLYLTADSDAVSVSNPLKMSVYAEKNGEEVTLSDGDVVWKAYSADNLRELGNRYVTFDDGCLYVTDSVIEQDITVRAQSVSGFVYASLPVRVKENSYDLIIASDNGENTAIAPISLPSWDGSNFYAIDVSTEMANSDGYIADAVNISADIKFAEENAGFALRSSGYIGGQVVRQGNSLGTIGSGNRFTVICSGDAESWYNIVINGDFNPESYGALISIYKYSDDGSKTAIITDKTLDLRSMVSDKAPYSYMEFAAGTYLDNLHVTLPMPDSIEMSLPTDTAYAGDTVQADYRMLRQGIEMGDFDTSKLTWEIYDENNEAPIEDVLVTVGAKGLVTIDAKTDNRTVYVRVTSEENSITASAPLTIIPKDVFTVTGVGFNKENTAITEIKVDKNFVYNGGVTFAVAVYNTEGALADAAINCMNANDLANGENTIGVDGLEVPEDFVETKVMIWTSL